MALFPFSQSPGIRSKRIMQLYATLSHDKANTQRLDCMGSTERQASWTTTAFS